MRYQGRILEWHDDRGFGFVEPNGGGDRCFLHIKDFGDRSRRPSAGDLITYEAGHDERGRKRASGARFVEHGSTTPRQGQRRTAPRIGRGVPTRAFVLIGLLVAAGGAHLYRSLAPGRDAMASPPMAVPQVPEKPFTCDGRTRCSQMTSCEDATRVLAHCPNTEMDGDGDGVPCETQWCN